MIAFCIASVLRTDPGDGQTTFFTIDRAARPLKKVLDRSLFASPQRYILFQFGAIELVAYGNNIGHGIPCGISQRFKLGKYITVPNTMSIANGRPTRSIRALAASPSCQSHSAVITDQVPKK
jgi:hypothetical protein